MLFLYISFLFCLKCALLVYSIVVWCGVGDAVIALRTAEQTKRRTETISPHQVTTTIIRPNSPRDTTYIHSTHTHIRTFPE